MKPYVLRPSTAGSRGAAVERDQPAEAARRVARELSRMSPTCRFVNAKSQTRLAPGKIAMKRMSVITPSFAADFEICADLPRSVLEFSPESVHHHIIVPRSDLKLFARLAGPRTHIRCE